MGCTSSSLKQTDVQDASWVLFPSEAAVSMKQMDALAAKKCAVNAGGCALVVCKELLLEVGSVGTAIVADKVDATMGTIAILHCTKVTKVNTMAATIHKIVYHDPASLAQMACAMALPNGEFAMPALSSPVLKQYGSGLMRGGSGLSSRAGSGSKGSPSRGGDKGLGTPSTGWVSPSEEAFSSPTQSTSVSLDRNSSGVGLHACHSTSTLLGHNSSLAEVAMIARASPGAGREMCARSEIDLNFETAVQEGSTSPQLPPPELVAAAPAQPERKSLKQPECFDLLANGLDDGEPFPAYTYVVEEDSD